jgi:peptidoglycan/xylan/chitin deacetylase (PgdA/CDA1 family)
MRIAVLFILLGCGLLSFGQKKQVCFSVDDLPFVSYGITDTIKLKQLMDKLIHSMEYNHIPAIGFVNERKLYDNGRLSKFQLSLLRSWIDHGLGIGNHTFSHSDYNSVSFKDYTKDILRGETVTNQLLKRKGQSVRYIRHPFLHVGNSRAKADSLNEFLTNHGYKVAPVTIDNEEYLFALAYQRAADKKDTNLMMQIGRDYVDYMERKVKYFETQASNLFGRNVSQILLIHANSLNSDYADSLAKMFLKNDYAFISMDKALEDEVYKTEVTVFGNWGISWIDKWALSQGKKGSFFKDEPPTPEYITKLAQ